jgi:hypothetical protein
MRLVLADVRWSQGIENAWVRTAAFIPKFLAFLAILAVGYLLAKAFATAVDKVLERTGFDRAVERGGIRRALARSRYDASDLVAKIAFYAAMLFVLQLAFGMFGPNPVSALIAGVIAFLPRLFLAIVIVVVATAIASAVRDIVGSSLSGLSYGRAVATAASVSIVMLGVFMALNELAIAPAIVNAVFYAILAVVAGSAIISIGGGGIQPMRDRWERALRRWDEESPRLRHELDGARDRREIDLRDREAAVAATAETEPVLVPTRARADETVVLATGGPMPSSAGFETETTQDRIRAEIRSESDTLP